MEIDQVQGGRQFWQERYEEWRSSDLSKAAFCRQASLSVTTFYYWCRVFDREGMKSSMHERGSAFVPLELTRESTSSYTIKLADVTLTCNQPISAGQLRQWLAVIRSSL